VFSLLPGVPQKNVVPPGRKKKKGLSPREKKGFRVSKGKPLPVKPLKRYKLPEGVTP